MAGPPQAPEQNPAGGRPRPGGLRSWFAGLGLTQKIGTFAALVGIAVGVVARVREIGPAPQPSFKAQLTGAMAPLVNADGALSGQLEALEGTVGPEAAVLGVRGTAVATAESAGQLNGLSTKGSSDERLRQSARSSSSRARTATTTRCAPCSSASRTISRAWLVRGSRR
jgi:hypothetical protein